MASDTVDRVLDYGETGSQDKGFSILDTKGLVGLDLVPMKSKGSDIALQVAKVGATMYKYMSIVEEFYYYHYSRN